MHNLLRVEDEFGDYKRPPKVAQSPEEQSLRKLLASKVNVSEAAATKEEAAVAAKKAKEEADGEAEALRQQIIALEEAAAKTQEEAAVAAKKAVVYLHYCSNLNP